MLSVAMRLLGFLPGLVVSAGWSEPAFEAGESLRSSRLRLPLDLSKRDGVKGGVCGCPDRLVSDVNPDVEYGVSCMADMLAVCLPPVCSIPITRYKNLYCALLRDDSIFVNVQAVARRRPVYGAF